MYICTHLYMYISEWEGNLKNRKCRVKEDTEDGMHRVKIHISHNRGKLNSANFNNITNGMNGQRQ